MKSNKNIDKDYEEEVKCTELPFNAEETLKVENSPLYVKYKKWLKDNGVLMDPRIRYPSYFGEAQKGIVGVSANKAIEKKRAIIAVPYNMLITIDKVRETEELSQIIKENLNIFRSDDEAALKTLVLYMSYELLKGEKSFYYPYFAISNEEHLNGWSNWTLYMLEQRGVISSVKQQK